MSIDASAVQVYGSRDQVVIPYVSGSQHAMFPQFSDEYPDLGVSRCQIRCEPLLELSPCRL